MSEENVRYGFVYIWFDRKHKRYYIGSHWGKEDDGYICSSRWMRKAFKRRQEDFKRRILSRVYTDQKDLLLEEQRWLEMIKPSEMTQMSDHPRYYNLVRRTDHHWLLDDQKKLAVSEKISASLTGRKWGKRAPEVGQKISAAMKGKPKSQEHKVKIAATLTGRTTTDKQKQAASEYNLTQRNYDDPEFRAKMSVAAKSRSPETRAKIAENNRRLQAEGKIGMKGRKHSPETIAKMRASQQRKAAERRNLHPPTPPQ